MSRLKTTIFLSGFIATLLLASIAVGKESVSGKLTVQVLDANSGCPIGARLYLRSDTGTWHYFTASTGNGSAVAYQKQNWINKNSVEYHTTATAHPVETTVPVGEYQLTIESGKSYLPRQFKVSVIAGNAKSVVASLTRWNDPASRGWYSGDTHLHREIDELRNIVQAEDLNVALPLTNWVTISGKAPSAGDKNISDVPTGLIRVDDQHVIWPRNTEYEIFSVGQTRHTLGALFVLGHREGLELGVPNWKPVIESVRSSDPDALFDMDKLDWPFAMLLPTIAPHALYELANNHVWRTEFAFRKWNTPAPAFMQPPYGTSQGGHREWLDYTMGMYYTLLNAGFRLPPSAGTANGVHPVPAGFGRVYVHLPDGFTFSKWMKALKRGRSFVTTGPMLYATANHHDPGKVFTADSPMSLRLDIEVQSEKPLSYGEVLLNGKPVILLRPKNRKTTTATYKSTIVENVSVDRSGWVAIRFWEPRPDGQSRFVHTAPWYIEIAGQPVRPSSEEKRYLIDRIKSEMERSKQIVDASAMQEYERALAHYQALPVADSGEQLPANARPLNDESRDTWLDNMINDHQYSAYEVRAATGLSVHEASEEIQKRQAQAQKSHQPGQGLRVLPYPGGRHPRRGFLEGAIDPQRETKISIFPPWPNGGYVVVDLPEAIFSNLGLTYLAHTHIPTIWKEQLPKLEWQRLGNGYQLERTLPNGIRVVSEVIPSREGANMKLRLTNGTDKRLTGMRVQVCTMLKGLTGFNTQEELTKVINDPFVALKSINSAEQRWLITAFQPSHRVWTNPPVPCVHSDPIFPDCDPGETVEIRGGLWFYVGDDVKAQIAKLQSQLSANP